VIFYLDFEYAVILW